MDTSESKLELTREETEIKREAKLEPRSAILTIDVDCMHGHIEFSGLRRKIRNRDDRCIELSYQKWIPRFLELLSHNQLKATFFLVASFARKASNAKIIRQIVDQGHEIASHTLNHCIELCEVDFDTKKEEIADSKKLLEDISGCRVDGFRGPGYAINREITQLLAENGYKYDSSVVPGYLFSLYKKFYWWFDRLFSGNPILYPNKPPSFRKEAYVISLNDGLSLLEIPLNVLPVFPIPLVSFIMLNKKRFKWMYRSAGKNAKPLVYQFHDFEFMDCSHGGEFVETVATRRICKVHLKKRLDLYTWITNVIKSDYSVITAQQYASNFRINPNVA